MLAKAAQINIGFNRFVERRQFDRLPVDSILLICTLALISIGLIMMTSASISSADKIFNNAFYYLERQSVFVLAGLVLGYVAWKVPLSFWYEIRPLLLVTGLLLLIVVLIPGVGQTVNGSTRWIRLGGINIQISEIAKILIVIFLAGYLTKQQEFLKHSIKTVIVPILLLLVVAGLLLAEPDFGATVVIFATALSMMLLAGVQLRVFVVLLGAAGAGLFVLAYTTPYRMQRMISFLDPWADPFNSGFQLSQSLIAFGRGEWFGVGLGESVQKLFYLPEAHTDFVFAVIAEEMGVIGALIVIGLYTCIAWRALKIGRSCQELGQHFAAFLSFGIGSWLIFQAYVNIGVNMGVLPTKGLTLPFMSYGGSSMIMSCFALALLLRADYELRFQYRETKKERRARS